MFNFEKLEVRQMAQDFARDIYRATSNFQSAERFGLTSQLRSASVSIVSNIAEGAGRFHKQDFVRFLRIAQGSIYECVTELFIAKNENYISEENFKALYLKTEIISKKTSALINSLLKPSSINHELSTSTEC